MLFKMMYGFLRLFCLVGVHDDFPFMTEQTESGVIVHAYRCIICNRVREYER